MQIQPKLTINTTASKQCLNTKKAHKITQLMKITADKTDCGNNPPHACADVCGDGG